MENDVSLSIEVQCFHYNRKWMILRLMNRFDAVIKIVNEVKGLVAYSVINNAFEY